MRTVSTCLQLLSIAAFAALSLTGCDAGQPAAPSADIAPTAPSTPAPAPEADTTQSASLAGAARWADPEPADLANAQTYALPGLIRTEMNLDNLRQLFGEGNVQLADLDGGEGETVQGVVLFADDPTRRAELFFKHPQQHSGIDTVRVRTDTSRWHLAGGVQPGMSLADLVQANDAPVSFLGLEWDYGGAITDWHHGKADPSTPDAHGIARLAPVAAQAGAYPTGEDTYRSDDTRYPTQGTVLHVSEVGVAFGE